MARVSFYLGSKVYPFCLDVPGVAEAESVTGFGLWALEGRLASLTCTAKEVQTLFRLGLTGAGLDEREALELTRVHVTIGRMEKARMIALAVVSDALAGVADAEAETERPAEGAPGKPAGGAAPPSASSTMGASTGAQSMAGSRSRGSRRRPSKGQASQT